MKCSDACLLHSAFRVPHSALCPSALYFRALLRPVKRPLYRRGRSGNPLSFSAPILKAILPDASFKEFQSSVPVKDVAAAIGPRLLKASIAAEVDGKVVGLDYKLPADGEVKVRILTQKDPEALGVMRHSAAHVMARAVMRLKKGVQPALGPTVESGIYYHF